MSENNTIKSITTHICPKCKEEIFVESSMTPPAVNSLFTAEDAKQAKEDCRLRVEALTIDDEKKNQVLKWLDDPDTLFSPGEVENIILSLLKPD